MEVPAPISVSTPPGFEECAGGVGMNDALHSLLGLQSVVMDVSFYLDGVFSRDADTGVMLLSEFVGIAVLFAQDSSYQVGWGIHIEGCGACGGACAWAWFVQVGVGFFCLESCFL